MSPLITSTWMNQFEFLNLSLATELWTRERKTAQSVGLHSVRPNRFSCKNCYMEKGAARSSTTRNFTRLKVQVMISWISNARRKRNVFAPKVFSSPATVGNCFVYLVNTLHVKPPQKVPDWKLNDCMWVINGVVHYVVIFSSLFSRFFYLIMFHLDYRMAHMGFFACMYSTTSDS